MMPSAVKRPRRRWRWAARPAVKASSPRRRWPCSVPTKALRRERRRRLLRVAVRVGESDVDDDADVAVGFVVSFVVALVVVRAFVHYISRHGFAPFAWYRIVAGAVALVWLAMR